MVSDEMGRRLVDGKDPTRCRPAPRSPSKLCDRSFDMATGFNGIWNWCGVPLSEAHRVLVPSGRLGLTFWGRYDHLGLIASSRSSSCLHQIMRQPVWSRETLDAGVVEDMLAATGFRVGGAWDG
jgi:hypothetical protein